MAMDMGIGGLTGGIMDSRLTKAIGNKIADAKIVKTLGNAFGDSLNKMTGWIGNAADAVKAKLIRDALDIKDAAAAGLKKLQNAMTIKKIDDNLVPAGTGGNVKLHDSPEPNPSSPSQHHKDFFKESEAGKQELASILKQNAKSSPEYKPPVDEMRQRILNNIAKSKAAREASNISIYLKNEKKLFEDIAKRQLEIENAINIARTKLAQERAELMQGKYIDPNTNETYLPNVITAAINKKTGKIYIGYNGVGTHFDTGNPRFNPTLSELVDETKKIIEISRQKIYDKTGKTTLQKWEVENCAEIQAINQVFKNNENINDIILSTISLNNGKYKALCKNCEITFEGFFIDIP